MRVKILATAMLFLISCSHAPSTSDPMTLDEIANRYVRLVLALGQHDDGYVDAYYGPESIAKDVEANLPSVAEIRNEAVSLLGKLDRMGSPSDPMLALRHSYLTRQIHALEFRTAMLLGETFSFDEESATLYGVVAPEIEDSTFQSILDRLDQLLPGSGSVAERYQDFRKQFVIPPDRLDAVFRRSIEECKSRTAQWIDLPSGERFRIEYVGDKPWSGYNWYQGEYESLIQLNTDYDIFIDRAIDLACHEGYPGHHVYNAMLEKNLAVDRGWIETTIYPLYSPQSLIAEGSANYGIQMAFPGAERTEFEREVLYPIAGLDPAKASLYGEIFTLVEELDYADVVAARRYLQGQATREQTAKWLEKYSLDAPDRALQRTRFFDTYRSYIVNYSLGQDLVRRWVESHGEDPAKRWDAFLQLLSSQRLPHDLAVR